MNENRVRSVFPYDDVEFPEAYKSFRIPSTSARPANPKPGVLIYNTTTNCLEAYLNQAWVNLTEEFSLDPNRIADCLQNLIQPGSNVKIESNEGSIRIHVPEVGDNTTAENIGQGVGIYRGKQGTNLHLRRLKSESEHLQINADADTITFTITEPGEPTLGRSIGNGIPVFKGKNGPELIFFSLSGSDSIQLVATPKGTIEVHLKPNLTLAGTHITVPSSSKGLFDPGAIRFNPELNAFEGVINDAGWVRFSTDRGTFLPLIGGSLSGLIYPDAGIHLREKAGIVLEDGSIMDRDGIFGISFANGGRITTGLRGTIDGYRIPAMGALFTELDKVAFGMIVRTPKGFDGVQIRGIESQIVIGDTFQIGIAPNPSLPGSASVLLPKGPTNARDDRIGAIRYNDRGQFEACYPSGWEVFATTKHAQFENIHIDGEMYITGRINGREIAADHDLLDQLKISRGLLWNGPNGITGARITSDPDRPGVHVSDSGSEIRIGISPEMIEDIADRISSKVDQDIVRADSLVHGRTIDGRNLAVDGVLIDDLKNLKPGLVVATGDGTFESNSIVPSARPSGIGLAVDNVVGSNAIVIGLRLNELPEVSILDDSDWVIVTTKNGNAKIRLSNLRSLLGVK